MFVMSIPDNGQDLGSVSADLESVMNIKIHRISRSRFFQEVGRNVFMSSDTINVAFDYIFKSIETDIDPYSCIHAADDSE